jgi:hypothetical protein
MPSYGILRRVAPVRTDVLKELIVSIIRVAREFLRSLRRLLVTANVVPTSSILVTSMMEALNFLRRRGSGTGSTEPREDK